VSSELQQLLAVQEDDERIAELHREADALSPRERELDRALEAESRAAERARQEADAEEERRKALSLRLAEHRRLHERNVAQLDQVKRMRDATAAQSQVEMARRILADEESELENLDRRLHAVRERIAAHDARREELLESQRPEREEIAARRAELKERIGEARAERDERAKGVSGKLLHSYDRIRGRVRGRAIFPLRGLSCGACDTAIPLQRRNIMTAGAIDLCETCGMLLYAAPREKSDASEESARV